MTLRRAETEKASTHITPRKIAMSTDPESPILTAPSLPPAQPKRSALQVKTPKTIDWSALKRFCKAPRMPMEK